MDQGNRLVVSLSQHPWWNLALEEHLLSQVSGEQAVLLLWQNDRTVVIGRHQNPWRECRLELLEAEGGLLARRATGGGAVYHDGGNLNFSFLMGRGVYDVPRQLQTVLDALASLGLAASFSGRNDLLVDGRKCSGNAFLQGRQASLHHGTLLVAGDLERLGRYLAVDPAKLAAKGVASVRSRVVNLAACLPGLTPPRLAAALGASFWRRYGGGGEAELVLPERLPAVAPLAARHASAAWRLGSTPPFGRVLQRRFPWGGVELALALEEGRVREAKVYTDALELDWPAALEEALQGIPYARQELAAAAAGCGCAELASWLATVEL